MDEKLKFIARYLEGETITDLCKDFGVSRTTGHNLVKRYRQMGSEALVAQSRAFAGVEVGIKEMEDGIWVVSFLDYDLGYFDDKSRKVEPITDPFTMGKVLTMSSV